MSKTKTKIYEMVTGKDHRLSLAEVRETRVNDTYKCFDPECVAQMMEEAFHISSLPEEHAWMIALDAALQTIGIFEISHGAVNYSVLPARSIIQRALLIGAVNVVIVHNHPSGDVTPTDTDEHYTKELQKALQLCDLILADHIILGGSFKGTYCSFSDTGRL